MPKPLAASQAVGAAAPVITIVGAAATLPQSLAERFPPTVPKVDEFTGHGGTFSLDPDTGVRVRVDEAEPDVVTLTGDGTGFAFPPIDGATEQPAA